VCPLTKPACARFKMPTVAHLSVTQDRGTQRAPHAIGSGSMLTSIAEPRCPPRPPLSSAYKRGSGQKYLPPSPFSSPSQRRPPPPTHRRLAAALPGHLPIPLADLILTLSCFFCPRFCDHWAGAPVSTTHPTGNLR
jgi:hypothetical protein